MGRFSSARALMYAGLPLLVPAIPAWAQTSGAPAQVQDGTQDNADGLHDIVVTAEKQSVSIQKAPAAITVISGANVASRGIQDLQQAQVLLPATRIGRSAVGTQVFIRGIGQKTDAANTDALAAVNLNGAGLIREAIGGSNLFDVDRIEALPGPQGTLYGNTAIGGVINVQLNQPVNDFEGKLEGEFGNYHSVHLTGFVNAPVADQVAVRLAANYNKADAYYRTGAGAVDDLGLRLSTKANFGERSSIYIWGSYSRSRGTGVTNILYPFQNPSNPYDDTTPTPGPIAPFAGPVRNDLYILAGKADFEIGTMTLSYIPSYVKYDSYTQFYAAGAAFTITSHTRQLSNELRLTNAPGSRLQFVGGLYQSSQRYLDFLADSSRGANFNIPYSRLTNLSAFAQGTYSITPSFRATVGARYGTSERTAHVNELVRIGTATVISPFDFQKRYNHLDWKVGTEIDIAPASMLYAVAQTGYAPGTYSATPSGAGQKLALDPSNLMAYTVGIKNRFFDRALQFNLEGFHYTYKNLLITNINPFNRVNQFYNAQKITVYGLQLDTALAVGRHTEFHGTVTYLHARNTEFVVPAVPPATTGTDYSGLEPVYAPVWTANFGFSQTFPIANGGQVVFRADSHTETGAWGAFEHRPGTTDVGLATYNPGYMKTDASLAYEAPGERFRLMVWVRNLENELHMASLTAVNTTTGTAFLERPRTYGITASVRF